MALDGRTQMAPQTSRKQFLNSMCWPSIEQDITTSTGRSFSIKQKISLSGGSINVAFRLIGEDGRNYFVKRNEKQGLAMFLAEADGLSELAGAHAIRVPEVICSAQDAHYSWLVTEYIPFGKGRADSNRLLGQQLACLHQRTSDSFGWFRDNTIGSTPQMNRQSKSWSSFYRSQRLAYQLDLAASNGFSASLQDKGQSLMANLDCFFTTYTPVPSLLHGDLWGGNYSFDEQGNPVLFDPALYYGDRETDIAMTELFGGFSAGFYAAYHEVWPLDAGYAQRKDLYNLYHILNHANLFGGGYAAQAESMMDQLLSGIR